MKKYKVRLVGMGIEAVGIIPFENEPTIEEVENTTALYLNENLMKVESDEKFYEYTGDHSFVSEGIENEYLNEIEKEIPQEDWVKGYKKWKKSQ